MTEEFLNMVEDLFKKEVSRNGLWSFFNCWDRSALLYFIPVLIGEIRYLQHQIAKLKRKE
jgi:hypothetical protein